MIKKEQLTGVILAGGQSRRMGQNKALLSLGGQTFLDRIAGVLTPLVQELVVVDNGALAGHWQGTLWQDNYPQQGPAAGIETALSQLQTSHALVVGCDFPLLEAAPLTYLLENSIPKQSTIFSLAGRWQPLVGVYAKAHHVYFEKALQQQQLQLRAVLQKLPLQVCACPVPWEACLSNINTLEAYQQLVNDFEH